MRYAEVVHEITRALRRHRSDQGYVPLGAGMVELLDLHPPSALAYALHQERVWSGSMRNQTSQGAAEERASGRRSAKIADRACLSFPVELLLERAEATAQRDGRAEVRESDVAAAFLPFESALQGLGIQVSALVEVTTTRELSTSASQGGKAVSAMPARSTPPVSYPTALAEGQPRYAMLIERAGEAQAALHALFSVSTVSERFPPGSPVITLQPWRWDPLPTASAPLLVAAQDAESRWMDASSRVIERGHGDLERFVELAEPLAAVIDRRSDGAGPPSATAGDAWRMADQALVAQLLLLRTVVDAAPVSEPLVVPDTNALIRWHELHRLGGWLPVVLGHRADSADRARSAQGRRPASPKTAS